MLNLLLITFIPSTPRLFFPIVCQAYPGSIGTFLVDVSILQLPFAILVKYSALFPTNCVLGDYNVTVLTPTYLEILSYRLLIVMNEDMGSALRASVELHLYLYIRNTEAVKVLGLICRLREHLHVG